jgi:hypothetical protein
LFSFLALNQPNPISYPPPPPPPPPRPSPPTKPTWTRLN